MTSQVGEPRALVGPIGLRRWVQAIAFAAATAGVAVGCGAAEETGGPGGGYRTAAIDRSQAASFQTQSRLVAVNDCGTLEAEVKASLKARVRDQIAHNLDGVMQHLQWCADYRERYPDWRDDDGGPVYAEADDGAAGGNAAPPSSGAPADNASSTAAGGGGAGDSAGGAGETAGEYSETNNQVAGVHEADIIKNDGKYIYLLSANRLMIFDAWPAPQTHAVANVAIEGRPVQMLVHAGRAVVFTDTTPNSCGGGGGEVGIAAMPADEYWPGPSQQPRSMTISVFDIETIGEPVLEAQFRANGSLISSRRIDNDVFAVLEYKDLLPQFQGYPDDHQWFNCWSEDELPAAGGVAAAFESLVAEHEAAIDALDLAGLGPNAALSRYDAAGNVVGEANAVYADCHNFYSSLTMPGEGFVSLLTFAMDAPEQFGSATVLGQGEEIYASHNAVYVAQREYKYNGRVSYLRSDIERTVIHKFNWVADDMTMPRYVGTGAVPGRIVNQFALDEHDGYLRVATTEGYLPSPDAINNVFVLEEGWLEPEEVPEPELSPAAERENELEAEVDTEADTSAASGTDAAPGAGSGAQADAASDADVVDEPVLPPAQVWGLRVAGSVTGLAPREDIRSVRFDGDRGFVVTFKKTDPLFALDLSDPAAPKVEGELKIPGFSTYMHMMDEDHLLAIGFDSDDQGSFAFFTGVLLQIFDVSDMTHPRRTHYTVIGSRGTTSDATGDHLAFNYFPQRKLLAVPMGVCESQDGSRWDTEMTFNGLMVFDIDADEGISLRGGVDHRGGAAGPGRDPYHCYNWWSNPNSQVKRSVFMGDGESEPYVYSVSTDALKVTHLSDLSRPLVSLALPEWDAEDPYGPRVCGHSAF